MDAFSRTNCTSKASWLRDFCDGSVVKTVLPLQRVKV